MSDLERVREGRFLELEEDKRVIAGEGGGKTGRVGVGAAVTGVLGVPVVSVVSVVSMVSVASVVSGLDGTTTGFRGEGPGSFLRWKRCRCEVAGWSGDWECKGMG